MPNFLIQIYSGIAFFLATTLGLWRSFPESTRVIIALGLCAFLIFSGSRSERTGWSVTLFFSAFAVFAYIFDMGIHMMQ